MEMIKYTVLVAIIACSTSIGFLLSKRYVDRLNELTDFDVLINILQNKIKFTQLPLKEVFEDIGKISLKTNVKNIFLRSSSNIENSNLEESWQKAIKEEQVLLNLKNEDIETISTLGSILGKSDIEGQISEIDEFKERLNFQIKQAEEEKRKNSKMFKSLGTIAGLVIVIILF